MEDRLLYTSDLDEFLNRDTLSQGLSITQGNSDAIFGSSSINASKIRNLEVNTLVVDEDGFIRSGKTAFDDIVNSGWFLSTDGFYVGAAGDTTYLKYDVSAGTFEFNGSHSAGTIGGLPISDVVNVSTSTANDVPTGLSVSSTGTSVSNGMVSAYITLTWDSITEDTFSHYKLRYKKNEFTFYNYIDVNENTITIDGLTPNTQYNFAIASVNKHGNLSSYSATVNGTTSVNEAPPAVVTGVSALGGIQYSIIEWTANSETDLSTYELYRSETNNSATSVKIADINATSYVDGGLTGGTTYYYWLKAKNTSGYSSDFSLVADATPRNVESEDIVTIAGSKVLIDGTTYLSDWRNSTDFTKIEGSNIYTGSITTTQLNFTPIQGTDVIASINSSAEGIKIDADNIEISGSTTFSSGYDPTDKVADLGGSYDSAASGARVRIFPDSNTGLQVIDNASNDVFKTIIGGTHVGDVYIGDYSGDQGMFYDKSASKFYFRGEITADDISAGTLSVNRLSAGSITSSKIGSDLTDSNISSINFNNITASNISATDITTGTLTVSSSDVGVKVENGGNIEFECDSYSTFSEISFTRKNYSNRGWDIQFTPTGGGGYNAGAMNIMPQSSNTYKTVWFGNAVGDSANVIITGNLSVDGRIGDGLEPSSNNSYALGSSSRRWSDTYTVAVNASGTVTANNVSTGNLTVSDAFITIGGTLFAAYDDPNAAGKKYLRSI